MTKNEIAMLIQERDELIAANEASSGFGAAVSVRLERIYAINAALNLEIGEDKPVGNSEDE